MGETNFFNNEATMSRPAIDIERVSILQRRHDLIEAYEAYKKLRLGNVTANLNIVRARLMSFFLQIEALVQRKKPDQYDLIKDVCFNSNNEAEIVEVIILLYRLLDEIKLTKIDTTRVYDTTNIELENEEHGF